MAEIEYGGIKIKGGKILIILSLLGTLGGAAWTGFTFYQDYLDMKAKIQEYTAPDLSEIEERLSVLESNSAETKDFVAEIRNDLKDDIRRTEDIAYNAEKFAKDSSRELQNDLKDLKNELELELNKVVKVHKIKPYNLMLNFIVVF